MFVRDLWWDFTLPAPHLWNRCSRMCILPKNDDKNKEWLWSKGYFSLIRQVLLKSGRETWSDFWVECLIATLHIPFENLQVMSFCWLKMELQICQKSWQLFCNLEISNFFIRKEKHGCVFFTAHRTVHTSQCTYHYIEVLWQPSLRTSAALWGC